VLWDRLARCAASALYHRSPPLRAAPRTNSAWQDVHLRASPPSHFAAECGSPWRQADSPAAAVQGWFGVALFAKEASLLAKQSGHPPRDTGRACIATPSSKRQSPASQRQAVLAVCAELSFRMSARFSGSSVQAGVRDSIPASSDAISAVIVAHSRRSPLKSRTWDLGPRSSAREGRP
jgi:hypothetical protein